MTEREVGWVCGTLWENGENGLLTYWKKVARFFSVTLGGSPLTTTVRCLSASTLASSAASWARISSTADSFTLPWAAPFDAAPAGAAAVTAGTAAAAAAGLRVAGPAGSCCCLGPGPCPRTIAGEDATLGSTAAPAPAAELTLTAEATAPFIAAGLKAAAMTAAGLEGGTCTAAGPGPCPLTTAPELRRGSGALDPGARRGCLLGDSQAAASVLTVSGESSAVLFKPGDMQCAV